MFTHKKKILFRYMFIVAVMALVGIAIIVKAAIIMFAERSYWETVKEKNRNQAAEVSKARRGDILADGGELLVSSSPEYTIFIDFACNNNCVKENLEKLQKAREAKKKNPKYIHKLEKRDSTISYRQNLSEISKGLARIVNNPNYNSEYFRKEIERGIKSNSTYFRLRLPRRLSHVQYVELKKLPVFCLSRYTSGLNPEENTERKHLFGDLGNSTLGGLYATNDSARAGLELMYDSILRGSNGIRHKEKIGDTYVYVSDVDPVDGYDVQTTLNVEMQDICQKAMLKGMRQWQAETGMCILMEVKSGDIKAMVNYQQFGEDNYVETGSYCLSDLMEPGSIFKTASMTAALDDGKVEITDSVCGFNGIHNFYGSNMKDLTLKPGNNSWLTMPEILIFSSNIGIAQVIDNNYGYRVDKSYRAYDRYVEKLHQFGLADNFHLLKGEKTPIIRYKKDYKSIPIAKTSLPWMATGYGVQVPTINMVTFYNTIANKGNMMRPRLVKSILKEGKVVEEFPTEVMRKQVCKPETAEKVRDILKMVVSHPRGTGRRAQAKNFTVAGKTGTAQLRGDGGGYSKQRHMLSFAGFFPADEPKYTLIVQIKELHGRAGGGGSSSALIFNEIAEQVMARYVARPLEQAIDTLNRAIPPVKSGNIKAAGYVLDKIEQKYYRDDNTPHQEWGRSSQKGDSIVLSATAQGSGTIPDVKGMGAKDAIYLLQSCGMRVSLGGSGKVYSQSPAAGSKAQPGGTVQILLK